MSLTRLSTLAVAACATIAASTRGAAQTTAFNPFAGSDSLRYQFDLSRNFFATAELASRDRAQLGRRIASWMDASRAADTIVQGAVTPRRAAWLAALIASADSIFTAGGKQLAYLSLLGYLQVNDLAAAQAQNDLSGQLGTIGARFNALLSRVPTGYFRLPLLARWDFAAEQARGAQAIQQATGANIALGPLTQWQAPLFFSLIRETPYGTIDTPEGKRDLRTEATALLNHPDRSVRDTTYHALKQTLLYHQSSFALLLNATIQAREAAARLSGFDDYRDQSYGGRDLSRKLVRDILETLAADAAVNKQYEGARRTHLAAVIGTDSVHYWDLGVSERGMEVPRFTITQASQIFRAAVAPLGTDYVRETNALLDPANGRLDLFARAGRAQRQGFSTGSVGYPSTFFQGRYGGYIEDLIVLVHEGGHSVQNMLMTANGVPSIYAGGPGYFTESFAGLNELLVMDYLYRTAPDRPHRIYYLQRFLDQATEVYKSANESLLEDILYDSIPAGTVVTAQQIERLTQNVGSRFSTWFGPNSERPMEWVNASFAIQRPLYRVNYVISKLLALNYFAEFLSDSASFRQRYHGLLAGGYPAPPNALLAKFGVPPIDAHSLVPPAVALIRNRLGELLKLYGEDRP